ncbi:type II toxin-antitoxin system RelB/DinJ family antitoxin [Brachyspira aalborgi]|uniref:Type II toxin-antitoxin system RelB/DinJ family antitoxin n=2 Tax=Brachyspira aalborgi TaxID=29522 RepID=A0A5C8G1Z6_9SPIR|nr:type II toxin-antitoxin system RelB/DinJ family antitoxin [Brachyspira aalborgi]
MMKIEIDNKVKKDADKLFKELGLDTNTAINIFLKQSINKRAIPFKVKNEEHNFYNKNNVRILKERYDKLHSKDKNSAIIKELIDE